MKTKIAFAAALVIMLSGCIDTANKIELEETDILPVETTAVQTAPAPLNMTEKAGEFPSPEDYVFDRSNLFGADVYDGEYSRPVLVGCSVPDDIWLFSIIDRDIMVIEHDGVRDFFGGRSWLSPRTILPQMYIADFDSDGTDEIAVTYSAATGTGISVYNLAVYKLNAQGHYEEFDLDNSLFLDMIDFTDSMDSRSRYVTIGLNGQTVQVQYPENAAENEVSAGVGNIVDFEFKEDRIFIKAVPSFPYFVYDNMPEIKGEILFSGSGFSVGRTLIDNPDNLITPDSERVYSEWENVAMPCMIGEVSQENWRIYRDFECLIIEKDGLFQKVDMYMSRLETADVKLYPADFDGDGRTDIAMISVTCGNNGRQTQQLTIFRQTEEGRYEACRFGGYKGRYFFGDLITAECCNEDKTVTFTVGADELSQRPLTDERGENVTFDVSAFEFDIERQLTDIVEETVEFDINGDNISIDVAPGASMGGTFIIDMPHVTASLIFDGEDFKAVNVRIL